MNSRRSKKSGDEESEAAAANGPNEDAEENEQINSSSSDDSSSSSEGRVTHSKGDWSIDLTTFSKTRTKLETALNSSTKCSELLEAYFDKKHTAFTRLPWEEKTTRSAYGIFPLHRYFYVQADKSDPDATIAISPNLYVKLSDGGKALIAELNIKHTDYDIANPYRWGDVKGGCIASYFQMLRQPKQALSALRRYFECNQTSIVTISKKQMKKLVKRCKKWIKANHAIWSTIVNHLDVTAMHICSGLEMSNGILLLSKIIAKFSHTHAQSLAALLRELTNLSLRKKDPDTHKVETVQAYMDRVQQIGRVTSKYPQMAVPIALPLMKVFALEGLLRSDPKYQNMVTTAYTNDLADTFERLTDHMQTVEGMRAKQVQDEFGSASSSNYSASVQTAKGRPWQTASSKGGRPNGPNDPCTMYNHYGHTNKGCLWQQLKKLKKEGRAEPIMYDSDGKKICEFLSNKLHCPFKKCTQSHRIRGATTKKVNKAARYSESESDDSSDEREHRRRKKAKKKKRRKAKKKKKHRKVHVARTSSESTSTSSDSDFP